MFQIKPVGVDALLVEFEERIDPEINDKVHALDKEIRRTRIEGVKELVPTYRSLLIYYKPLKIEYDDLRRIVEEIGERVESMDLESMERTVFELPTLYGGEPGPDLGEVAEENDLGDEEVIDIHSSKEYRIYMMGFTPGFTYLGEVPNRIGSPRLDDPRKRIPPGSVGIAGNQTGIYPIESPGGWKLIGRTPIQLYTPETDPPVAFEPGNIIKFKPINKEKYGKIKERIESGEYELKTGRS